MAAKLIRTGNKGATTFMSSWRFREERSSFRRETTSATGRTVPQGTSECGIELISPIRLRIVGVLFFLKEIPVKL
jgi:hypothetical protein